MTKTRIILYGVLKSDLGTNEIQLDALPGDATLQALIDYLEISVPPLSPRLPSVVYAVNNEIVEPDHQLSEGDLVALLPPVSGG
jgi:molybdopterin converting factor small subunit